MSSKKCFKCGEVKSRSEFYKHSKMGDGLLGKCKECTKADAQANYRNRIPQYKSHEKQRAKSIGRKKWRICQQRIIRARHPDKYRARSAVSAAVRDGRLIKKPCRDCGEATTEAHHEDYSRPLDVIWLCRPCHRAEHGKPILTEPKPPKPAKEPTP